MRQFAADASHELRTPLTAIKGFAEYYRQRGGVAAERQRRRAHPRGPRPDHAPGRGRGHQDGPARRGPAAAGPDRPAASARAAPGGHAGARRRRRAGRQRDRPGPRGAAHRRARHRLPGHRRRGAAAPGHRQPHEQRADPHPGRNPDPGARPLRRSVPGWIPGTPRCPAVVLEVVDHGPGMSPDQAQRVFERFYRADQARARQTGGTGLGLAIVSALVSAHGGAVAVDTEPGRGATFRVACRWLPRPRGRTLRSDRVLRPRRPVRQVGPASRLTRSSGEGPEGVSGAQGGAGGTTGLGGVTRAEQADMDQQRVQLVQRDARPPAV